MNSFRPTKIRLGHVRLEPPVHSLNCATSWHTECPKSAMSISVPICAFILCHRHEKTIGSTKLGADTQSLFGLLPPTLSLLGNSLTLAVGSPSHSSSNNATSFTCNIVQRIRLLFVHVIPIPKSCCTSTPSGFLNIGLHGCKV